MPSNLPSSFASAAAGQNSNSRGGRSDGRGATSGDWAKRDGRSTNGTLTFRRSSTTPLGQPSSQPPPSTDHAVQHPATESPVSVSASTYEVPPTRYTKDDLLAVFRPQQSGEDVTHLFASGWNPGQVNGHAPRGWGKSNDNHIPQEPGACWDDSGDITPIGLQDMSLEEKEAFNTEINSPLKPPTQNKDTHQAGTNGRKASLSQGASNTFGVSSPSSATRPGTRRRETIESNPFGGSALASPTAAGRFSRDDAPYWLGRSKTDLKESEPDESDPDSISREAPGKLPPFGNLMRSNTGGIGGVGSIWPPSNQTTPGAGGFGNFALASPAIGDKRVGGAASGSRLAHLMPKDSSDNLSGKVAEAQSPLNQQSWRSRPRTDTDPFGDDVLSGSAVLGGAQDTDTVGMSQQGNRAGTLGTPIKGSAGDFGMAGLNLGSHGDDGPASPSETNPYRSPPTERHGHDDNDSHDDKPHGANLHDAPSNFGSIGRGFGGYDGGDRSQTSSVGAKGYPSLNTLAGWPAPGGPAIGTPDRERPNLGNAFGSSLFSPMGDLQSPGMSGLGNLFGPASAGGLGTGSIGRGSKISSLFPAAMQAQMQSQEQQHDNNLADSLPDLRQGNPLGAIGRTNFGIPSRDTESPMRPNRGVFEELFPSSDASRAQGVFNTGDSSHPTAATAPQSFTPIGGGLPFGGQGGTELPATQHRQMVMPDRMRWVYLDPQGQVQGPFTGLEMNDWYKANFFTPDLRVKKVEDSDFEPLGQLIRRIGNSREPFLVPQIGIAHGPPSQAGPFSPQGGNSGVVPPLSGVFPSFGRTLTAEEQNNLERRKQEEQYLMVQQREYVMRAQAMSKFPIPGPMLQHHSSAHSLQSQPSFGSISSPNPIGMPHQQPIGAMPPSGAFFEGAGPVGQPSAPSVSGNGDPFRDDDLTNFANTERQLLANLQASGVPQPIRAPAADAGARAGLPDTEDLEQDDEGFKERLQEFENYQAQLEAEQAAKAVEGSEEEPSEESSPASEAASEETRRRVEAPALTGKAARAARKKAAEDALSLTQQVQQTQAAAAAAAAQPVEPDMPMPFPPPASTGTPLPAPTAQRARSNLPEQYNRSQTGTPDSVANAQPPPLAPWAKDHGAESHKGPSLKEIQEAEARKAAKAEEAAAAQRKAVLEQEAAALREREKTAAVTNAGLPATSTWGHGSPAPSASPWSKPGPSKTASIATPSASTSSKKTLAEIQREEELRKQKATQASPQPITPTIVSKSYANLAGKTGQSSLTNAAAAAAAAAATVPPPGSGWATVGAGGKVKGSLGPSSQSRSVSVTSIKPITSPAKGVSKPATSSNGKTESGNTAMEEFNKWVTREITRGITAAIDIPTFQATLDVLPLDTSLIADAIYSNSETMDGRHFAEEFVRRKKLAERGIVEKQPENKGGSGGWSEVAKKGSSSTTTATTATSPRDDTTMQAAGFKVVPGRKKGKK
ncbi:GYF domain-containing protein [Fusarium heterosporum]|uniref:GYF domain-containing protein n=1 Tax=Fusarium heterosporum TaxID=42747 RepID=A0A8H5WKM2_FUSHE|nr:GYF domain-containing protein [Fusarium heterosporum]